jgi:hypothetical protein
VLGTKEEAVEPPATGQSYDIDLFAGEFGRGDDIRIALSQAARYVGPFTDNDVQCETGLFVLWNTLLIRRSRTATAPITTYLGTVCSHERSAQQDHSHDVVAVT